MNHIIDNTREAVTFSLTCLSANAVMSRFVLMLFSISCLGFSSLAVNYEEIKAHFQANHVFYFENGVMSDFDQHKMINYIKHDEKAL